MGSGRWTIARGILRIRSYIFASKRTEFYRRPKRNTATIHRADVIEDVSRGLLDKNREITIDDVPEERVTTSWYYIADRWIDCRLFSLFLVERRRVDYPELIIGEEKRDWSQRHRRKSKRRRLAAREKTGGPFKAECADRSTRMRTLARFPRAAFSFFFPFFYPLDGSIR